MSKYNQLLRRYHELLFISNDMKCCGNCRYMVTHDGSQFSCLRTKKGDNVCADWQTDNKTNTQRSLL
jgi:hypothetical protein